MSKTSFFIVVCSISMGYALGIGDKAPDFTLYHYDNKATWTLSDHIGDKVILLISGSFC